jgi:hypothetical protein
MNRIKSQRFNTLCNLNAAHQGKKILGRSKKLGGSKYPFREKIIEEKIFYDSK